MPRFKVHVRRVIEQYRTIFIEADTAQSAHDKVQSGDIDYDDESDTSATATAWEEGVEIKDNVSPFTVYAAEGDPHWREPLYETPGYE